MQQQKKPQTNGHNDSEPIQQVRDELGLQEQILKSGGSNPLLESTNLGLGKYDDDYKWQQVRSYRKGLYAWVAFGQALEKRKLYETKIKLGRDGYNPYYDDSSGVRVWNALDEDDVADDESSWNSALERGREIWQRLGDPKEIITKEQVAAVASKTSIDDEWQPLFWELVAGRHEVSRSEDAELLRDSLTGIKELRDQTADDGGLLG